MKKKELNDKLSQVFDACKLHIQRMNFANSKVQSFLPLTRDNYYELDEETISFIDQFIFRFSKLQDLMGARLFPSILELLAEPVYDKAFIDILNRLEKLHVIESATEWVELRNIRNDIAHEYPASLLERIEGINVLFNNWGKLEQIVEKCWLVFNKQTNS